MKKSYIIAAASLLFAFMMLTGFECASTEMTSAKLYLQQKNYDKAIDALQKETEKNPKSDEGNYLLGYLYNERDDYDKMIGAFKKSLAISNKYEKDITNVKKSAWAKTFNRGVSFFGKATNSPKDSATMHFDKSAESFLLAIKIEPDSILTYKNLAFVYFNLGQEDKAIEPLVTLATRGQDPEGYRYLGEIYSNKASNLMLTYVKSKKTADSVTAMGHYDEAINWLEKGRKVAPGNAEILRILANSYIGAHKTEIAMATFKEGVIQDPNNELYRYNYGVLLLGANLFSEAETQFKKALELKPEYLNAGYNLAVTYVKWGAAIQKKAEETQKNDPAALEKIRQALPHLEKYVEKKPDDSMVWELLGKVYSYLNMTNEAKSAFDKADKLR
jgi:tetratricopeptide (TPR) repeat protein